MSIVLLEPFLKRVHVFNVRFRCLRLANLIELIELPLLFLVLLDLLLYLAKLVLDEALTLVIVKGRHATKVKEGQLGEGLGVSDKLPLFEEHAGFVSGTEREGKGLGLHRLQETMGLRDS